MAGRLGGQAGGIAGLRDLIRCHKEAVEYDLIRLGLRLDWLGTERLSWRDLLVIVKQSPRGCAIDLAVNGDDALWGLPEQLLAAAVDELRMLVWIQSKDGQKGRARPKPLPRPGVKGPDQEHIGNASVEIEEMEAWLAKRNPHQHRKE